MLSGDGGSDGTGSDRVEGAAAGGWVTTRGAITWMRGSVVGSTPVSAV
jgi:hypothetical protein